MKTIELLEFKCLLALESSKKEKAKAEREEDVSRYAWYSGNITALECVLETICEEVDIKDIEK